MAAYETPEQAANFLAGIHLDILNTGKGDFSPNHVKYTCQLTPRYGDPFTTDYQSNPSVHGEPTVTQVMSSLLSDSRIPDAYHDVDDFADDMGYRKPSEAIRAWEGCRKAQDWVRDTLNLSNGEANQLSDTLDEYETEVQAQVEQLQEEQARQDAYEHPPVDQMLYGGQKFITIKEAIDNLLDLGDYGEDAVDYVNGASYIDDALQEAADGMVDIYYHDLLHWLPDNYEWLEEADAQGLLEGCKGDLMKMTQAAQYECYSQNLYDHKADILAAVTLAHLKDQGVYAISEDMADTLIEGIRDASDGMNRFSDATDLAEETMSDSLTEALGDEDGELSADMADTLRDSGYDKPNPCMMSAEAVRQANRDGYDQAFQNAWHDLLAEHPEVGGDSLTHAAEESRDSSTRLAQNHGNDAPSHEDTRAEL